MPGPSSCHANLGMSRGADPSHVGFKSYEPTDDIPEVKYKEFDVGYI
jgi:hypothetical protein